MFSLLIAINEFGHVSAPLEIQSVLEWLRDAIRQFNVTEGIFTLDSLDG